MRVAIASWAVLGCLGLACTAGTEPSTNPRQEGTDPRATGRVSGRVITAGTTTRARGAPQGAEGHDSAAGRWMKIGSVAGEAIRPSRPLSGVAVELGIVRFDRSSDSVPEGTSRSVLVPFAVADAWVGPELTVVEPGPGAPPGRFEVIARATTNGRGEFRFPRAPLGQMLMVRARPPAPYLETYSSTPFLLDIRTAQEVDVVLRRGPR
jgi:hypothetical protein